MQKMLDERRGFAIARHPQGDVELEGMRIISTPPGVSVVQQNK
jgi:hypothetical protein